MKNQNNFTVCLLWADEDKNIAAAMYDCLTLCGANVTSPMGHPSGSEKNTAGSSVNAELLIIILSSAFAEKVKTTHELNSWLGFSGEIVVIRTDRTEAEDLSALTGIIKTIRWSYNPGAIASTMVKIGETGKEPSEKGEKGSRNVHSTGSGNIINQGDFKNDGEMNIRS